MVKIGGLSIAQRVAIEALVFGVTTASAARFAGVSRQTVSAWLNHDAAFKAELAGRAKDTASSIAAKDMQTAGNGA